MANLTITEELISSITSTRLRSGLDLDDACSYLEIDFQALNKHLIDARSGKAKDPLIIKLFQKINKVDAILSSPILINEYLRNEITKYHPANSTTITPEIISGIFDVISTEGIAYHTACDLLEIDQAVGAQWLKDSEELNKAVKKANAVYDTFLLRKLNIAHPDAAKQIAALINTRKTLIQPKSHEEVEDETTLRRLETKKRMKELEAPTQNNFSFVMIGKNAEIPPEVKALIEGKSNKI